MKFTTPCFVRIENAGKRKEMTEWLKGIGYTVCRCCFFDGWNTLHCGAISEMGGGSWVHGIPDYDEDTGSNIGWFKAEDADKEYPSYDCGENIELFKALAAMNDENDLNQWYVCDVPYWCDLRQGDWVIKRDTMDHTTFFPSVFHKATVAEIIEHLKKSEN